MNYRHVGKWGVQVSEVGLGSWLTYGGATEAEQATACIHRAYELGINFFDTANAYAGGESERVVGAALQAFPRESYVLSTKVFFPMGSGPNNWGLSRKHIMEQCNASLRRLGVDYIDLYYCHRYDSHTPLEETLTALHDLVLQGKILYAGVSEWTAGQIAHAVDYSRGAGLRPLVSNQPQYNMLARGIEKEILPLCEREGIGQVVFSPLAQGILTGKYQPGQPPPEGSRAADPKQNQFLKTGVVDAYVNDKIQVDDGLLERVQQLTPLSEEAGLTMSQLALAWCLRQKNISSVIIGASRPSQIEDNIAASGRILDAALLARIDEVLGI
ncbi:L-glyceraldehyde 3-phosphate reductase [Abditibacteriota bacterium]|nr:L-glyceraldehyde 3-phosphate reductase [Abditibacteriota bacterium]